MPADDPNWTNPSVSAPLPSSGYLPTVTWALSFMKGCAGLSTSRPSSLLPQITYAFPFWGPTALQCAALNTLIARPLLHVLRLAFSTHRLTLLLECGCPDI